MAHHQAPTNLDLLQQAWEAPNLDKDLPPPPSDIAFDDQDFGDFESASLPPSPPPKDPPQRTVNSPDSTTDSSLQPMHFAPSRRVFSSLLSLASSSRSRTDPIYTPLLSEPEGESDTQTVKQHPVPTQRGAWNSGTLAFSKFTATRDSSAQKWKKSFVDRERGEFERVVGEAAGRKVPMVVSSHRSEASAVPPPSERSCHSTPPSVAKSQGSVQREVEDWMDGERKAWGP